MNGQSIGKKILKIRVVSLDGGEATLGQSLLRWFLRFYEWGFIITSLFYGNPVIGFMVIMLGGISTVIIIAVTPKNQRLGDLAAGTVVVNIKSKLTVDDTIFREVNTADYKVTFPDVMRLSDRDINTIKGVVTQAGKTSNYEMCNRVAMKVKDVLKIQTDMYPDQFLEKLLEDYNYLATRE
jgi:RDD family